MKITPFLLYWTFRIRYSKRRILHICTNQKHGEVERRTTKGLTPKSEKEVRENLFEELSDVLMNIEQIKYLFDKELSDTSVENVIKKWHSYKADRWYKRTFISQEEN